MTIPRSWLVAGTATALAGCSITLPGNLRDPSTAGLISEYSDSYTRGPAPAASASTKPGGASPTPTPTPTAVNPIDPSAMLSGRILLPSIDLVSHGAANLISDNAARLISDNAAKLISDNAAQLISHNSAALTENNASSYRRILGLAGYGLLSEDWTETPTSSARVALADEAGNLLSQVVGVDASGRFSLPIPTTAAFLVAEVAGKLGLARIVAPGQTDADITVDHTLVAMKAASLARRSKVSPASLVGAPLDDLYAAVRTALTPGTMPYLDSGPGEVVSAFDQIVTDRATASAKAMSASVEFAERRFEWSVTTIATGSEDQPFAFGGYSVHPVTGDVYFLPNGGHKEIGKLGVDGVITPVVSLSGTVQLSFSSTVTADGQLYALVLVKPTSDPRFVIRLEQIDLASGQVVREGDLYAGADALLSGGGGPTDGYSLALGTIAAVNGNVYMPHHVFHLIYRVEPSGADTFTTGSIYAGGLSKAGYHDGLPGNTLFREPAAVTLAPDGALYVTDAGNFVVRKIDFTKGGLVSTFAGSGEKGRDSGKARFARFGILDSVALDAEGNAFVLDPKLNHEIRWISKAGQVFSLAGGRGEGVKDGIGLQAEFHDARFLELAPDGTLYVVDRTGPGGTYYFKAIRPIPR